MNQRGLCVLTRRSSRPEPLLVPLDEKNFAVTHMPEKSINEDARALPLYSGHWSQSGQNIPPCLSIVINCSDVGVYINNAEDSRVVNNTLQAKFLGAAMELARFTINSTVGVAGFFDVAKEGFGIEQRDEDAGQTFGVWGMGPGPYLVLPFLPPLTLRDGIGYALDIAMTPYTYFIPWYASIGGTATNTVNERSLNLESFERVTESTVDLYSAVRNGYLQRRAAAIRQ
jgi:phospholipid-binding lipoprotein MlaA